MAASRTKPRRWRRGASASTLAFAAFCSVFGSLPLAGPVASEPRVGHPTSHAEKKGSPDEPTPVLATLFVPRTREYVLMDGSNPTNDEFSALLADRVTGEVHPLDPSLLALLRTLARKYEGARIDLVSGYRSPKLNEMLRKKGRHVANHSQHSLGHAVDFRVVPPTTGQAIDPRRLHRIVRRMGWGGGIGIYPHPTDWFMHADVGPNRQWRG